MRPKDISFTFGFGFWYGFSTACVSRPGIRVYHLAIGFIAITFVCYIRKRK